MGGTSDKRVCENEVQNDDSHNDGDGDMSHIRLPPNTEEARRTLKWLNE